ncbi:uncharacterized protein LOC112569152 isoform X2 [Pomacea canaliculata]|uniref:uncharacterized protein LOC112569152 isoform X2 n=1 Tax=Pomacea canaliculata TaxID=400727 RepID=UPI000D73CED0|nr:uncharacterized protein LOC112569152 isoform X2 [Pomacea canaliculata]
MAVWRLWILCGIALLATEHGSGLIIDGCQQGSVDVVEDSTRSFTCDAYRNKPVQITAYNDKMEIIFFRSCINKECTPWNDKFELFELYYYYYQSINYYKLKMNGITRNLARTLSCSDSLTYARCDFRIIVAPVYSLGDCSVSISNWMVIGSCTVKRMFSSNNNYTCKWRENENYEEFGGYGTTLRNYTAVNLRTYTKDGPYVVKLNHNCPEYVFEGSDVSCTCYASRDVTPPALLVWKGMNNATLLLKNVTRQLNKQFTCRLQWRPDGSIKESISYKFTVAYGPLNAVITNNEKKTEDESETISLTCTATDVYPSAAFQWNVTCSNQTDSWNSSTCFFNFTQKFESLSILCTASNTYFHQEYASNVYVLSSSESQQASTGGPNAGLIGGVIAAVLVVLIIVGVLIVYIIKRRKGTLDRERGFFGFVSDVRKQYHRELAMSQQYAVVNTPQTQTQTQTPIRREAGPSGDMYTITKATSSGHVVDEYAAVCKTSFNNTGGTESDGAHQTTQKTQQPTTASKPTTKPTLTVNSRNVQDLHGTVYMNVTEVPTDSGLGVYHVVPWATMSGSPLPDTNEYSLPSISEDEYNELHFEEDRTGQENQADNYHHLQIT